jgi:glycosyltransferase involved in cell wall biosynthesis
MRIAMVSEHASPLAALGGADAGGQNVHVAALARALARAGHEVTVHTRRDSADLPVTVQLDGYTVHHLQAGPARRVPKDDLLPHVPAMARDLARHWADAPPDVVHAHFWMSGLACLAAVRASGLPLPVALTFHALGTVKRAHLGPGDPSPRERIAVERSIGRDVDVVVATATEEAVEVRSWGVPDSRVHVVPCGVELDLFDPAVPPPGARRVLSLGRLVPRKGVAEVIDALADVPGAHLVVAGGPPPPGLEDDPEITRLRARARRAGVDDRVAFLGAVTRDAVPGLIAGSDVVVCAPWYEPFGIVPLEAMAAGRPLVATAVGGILDSVVGSGPTATGLLVPPRRPDALARALSAVLDDAELAARLGRAGARRAAALYGWDRIAAQTAAAYRSAIAARTTPGPTPPTPRPAERTPVSAPPTAVAGAGR